MNLKNCADAKSVVHEIIDIYNTARPHLSIGMLTPDQAHQKTGILKKLWKTYKRKKENEIIV